MPLTLEEVEKRYGQETVKLLELTEKRAWLVETLKHVSFKTKNRIYNAITECDKVIESTEQILELLEKQRISLLDLRDKESELFQIIEKIKPDFLTHTAENNPELFDSVEEIFCDQISSSLH